MKTKEEKPQRFPIGTKFTLRGRNRKDRYVVVDFLTTRNKDGEVVQYEYLATHEFMKQTMTDRFPESTIAMGKPEFEEAAS